MSFNPVKVKINVDGGEVKVKLILSERFYNLKDELKNLFKDQHNTLYFKDAVFNKDAFNPFEEHGDIERNELVYRNDLVYINSEFEPSTDKEVNNLILHYYLKFSGSDAFKALLKKYNLNYEWGDVCYGFIYHEDQYNYNDIHNEEQE